jgi:hypothetical protein
MRRAARLAYIPAVGDSCRESPAMPNRFFLAFAALLCLAPLCGCGPQVPGFDGSFPPIDVEGVDQGVCNPDPDAAEDPDAACPMLPDSGGPCLGPGSHCNSNSDCCANACSLGSHTCS